MSLVAFGSPAFWLLLALVYPLYLLIHGRPRLRNILLLLVSYALYALWSGWFLGLLILSTLVSFWIALRLGRTTSPYRSALFWIGVLFQIGVLAVFKYAGFFAENLAELFAMLGMTLDAPTLRLLLPLGISFYTFQIVGYLIDVRRGTHPPTGDLLDYALTIAFFPKIAAGPIERVGRLLPQFREHHPVTRERFAEGCYLIVWGLIQKMVIADNVGLIASDFLSGAHPIHLLTGALAVTLQIYADFSGYSDMAKGTAALLGFDLSWNFKIPYASTNPSDFWKRWHITLSEWFRDYVYFGLGGSRRGLARACGNLMITMTLVGLWHGARWTFIFWGAYQGLLLVLYRLSGAVRLPEEFLAPWKRYGGAWLLFFLLTMVGWILFSSETVAQFGSALVDRPLGILDDSWLPIVLLLWLPVVLMQIFQTERDDLLAVAHLRLPWQLCFYYAAWYMLLYLPYMRPQQFIYVQF